jgi:Protein of unknown function (DUF1488)
MPLSFPNQSRSYDAVRRRICFWGHDGTTEVPFFLDEDVVFVLMPKTKNTEAGILAAFDSACERVFEAAARAYAPGQHRSFYRLTTQQF